MNPRRRSPQGLGRRREVSAPLPRVGAVEGESDPLVGLPVVGRSFIDGPGAVELAVLGEHDLEPGRRDTRVDIVVLGALTCGHTLVVPSRPGDVTLVIGHGVVVAAAYRLREGAMGGFGLAVSV